MPIIRNIKIKNVKDIINNSKLFSINDFKLEFPDNGNILLNIKYRASSLYLFRIEENQISSGILDFQATLANKKKETVLQTIQQPGNNKNIEVHDHKNIDQCIKELRDWLINLDEDLRNEIDFTINDLSKIDDFEKKLDEFFPDETEKFSNEEKETLLKKLNELQERIEKLEDNEKDIAILEKSKTELQTYPKKSFWLKFYNRVSAVNNGVSLANRLQDNIAILLEKFGSIQ